MWKLEVDLWEGQVDGWWKVKDFVNFRWELDNWSQLPGIWKLEADSGRGLGGHSEAEVEVFRQLPKGT